MFDFFNTTLTFYRCTNKKMIKNTGNYLNIETNPPLYPSGAFLLKTTCLWEYLILTNIPVLICTLPNMSMAISKYQEGLEYH